MKPRVNLNIRARIYWSFSLLVFLFVINGVITIVTINNIRKSSARLTNVVDPSVHVLNDLRKLVVESKMYATNWVFLRSNQEDKDLLVRLHDTEYPALKPKIEHLTAEWVNRDLADTVRLVFHELEDLLVIQNKIMSSLKSFSDYDDPVTRLEAERVVEEEVLPRTAQLVRQIDMARDYGVEVRSREAVHMERTSNRLRLFIVFLAALIIIAGLVMSTYMTSSIVGPVKRIQGIINDLGRGIIRTIPQPVNKDEISEMIRSVNNLSGKLSVTTAFANEIGNRNFSSWYEPLSTDDTLGHALIQMRDNLRQNETTLEVRTKELERKNKELEQFVYIASHDLQEPLRTTSSFVELLQQQYNGKLDMQADQYLTFITQSSDRMRVLINDLLDYSRIGNKKELELIDSNLLLAEVMDDMQKTIGDVKADIRAGALPLIMGFRTEIKQLFQNLLVNAVKFRKPESSPEVRISASKHDGEWIFSVRDNGIGIATDHRDRIFIIFQRLHTRSEYEGSGIGLAHCKKIVGLHGGRIWVESTPGHGASFYFTIPEINNQ
jgi:signal transduction histidine kinase